MGKMITGRVRSLKLNRKIMHPLLFTIALCIFILQCWQNPKEAEAAITQPGAWTAAINVAGNSGTYSYTAASGSSRVVVVTITSTHATASTYTPTVTLGGTALTLAAGDTTVSMRNHTAIYYMKETIPSGAQTLSVSLGVTTQRLYVGVATFAGVDQTTPIDTSQNANRDTDGVTAVFSTALTINANDQAILATNLYNHTDTQAIWAFTDPPTGWSASAINNNGTTTNAWQFFVSNYATIPASITTTTASWGTNLTPGTIGFSMTGVSLKMAAASSCTAYNAPSVSFNPISGNVTQGGSKNYTVTITNNDTPSGCASTTFSLTAGDSDSTNFNPSTLSPTSCTASGGGTCTSTLTVSAKAGGTVGNSDTTTVSAADSVNHSGKTGSGTVVTTIVATGGSQVPAGNIILFAAVFLGIFVYGVRKLKKGENDQA